MNGAANLYQSLVDNNSPLDISAFSSYPVVDELMNQLSDLKSELAESPLFSLLLQYIDMIDILYLNIYAERTGKSHLDCVRLVFEITQSSTC